MLRSDYIILRDFGGPNSWLGVREVLEVDGEPVTVDRARLQALLDDTTRPLASRVRALADLQAKYNLGEVYRTINVPTLPLDFLLARPPAAVSFQAHRHHGLSAIAPVWIVSFNERDRPTIIRTPEGHDVPSSGCVLDRSSIPVRFFAASSAPAKSPAARSARSSWSSYRHNARFDMLLPDDMNELYLTGRTRIEGHATYSNYRRWEAEVTIK